MKWFAIVASNAVWIPICLVALGLIAWDMRHPKTRWFVIAFAVAVTLATGHIFAQDYSWEACEACKQLPWALWWAAGCFLC